MASTTSRQFQLGDDLGLQRSGSASSTASVRCGDLYDLMPLEDEMDVVISRDECKGLHGFRTSTRVWVATWQEMRKGVRVTQASER